MKNIHLFISLVNEVQSVNLDYLYPGVSLAFEICTLGLYSLRLCLSIVIFLVADISWLGPKAQESAEFYMTSLILVFIYGCS